MARIIGIVSGKGGTGKSTIAAALSLALARIGSSVLAVDLDSGLRSLDLLLGVEDRVVFDLRDVQTGMRPLEDALVSCSAELSLLCAPPDGTPPDAGALCSMLRQLSGRYEYIVLDLPAGIGFSTEVARQIADLVVLVATPDLLTMRDARNTADMILRQTGKACRLIVNKVSRNTMLAGGLADLDEMMDAVGIPLLAVVPEDAFINVTQERARGSLRRNPLTDRVFEALARRITGEYVPLLMKTI